MPTLPSGLKHLIANARESVSWMGHGWTRNATWRIPLFRNAINALSFFCGGGKVGCDFALTVIFDSLLDGSDGSR